MTELAAPGIAPPPRPRTRPVTAARIAGFVLLGLWALLAVALLSLIVLGYDPDKLTTYLPRLLDGLWTTVQLVVISFVIGAVLSIPIAAGRLSQNWIAGGLAFGYSYFFRGTPLLAQTFLIYYGFGEFIDAYRLAPVFRAWGVWWFFRDAYYYVLLTFALNTAAYQAEILAGAIRSVSKGQWQAADSLGLPRRVTVRKIILPQALITALRPYGNEIVLLMKGSAVAAIVTVLDLMGQTRFAYSRTYDLQMYVWAGIFYFAIVEGLRRIWDVLERRLTRHLVRASDE